MDLHKYHGLDSIVIITIAVMVAGVAMAYGRLIAARIAALTRSCSGE